jgi:hypothetical protein
MQGEASTRETVTRETKTGEGGRTRTEKIWRRQDDMQAFKRTARTT